MNPLDYLPCACGEVRMRAELWREFGPDILDRSGLHVRAPGECIPVERLPVLTAERARELG